MMNCTSCHQGVLQNDYLDDLFPCFTCNHCSGNLVFLNDYLRWLENNNNKDAVSDVDTDVEVDTDDTKKAILCPKTSRIMLKYRISKDSEHRLDLSPSINAVWMDKGEWMLLKKAGLAGKLNKIFTHVWQRKIREDETSSTLIALYEKEFGDHYTDIKAFKKIIDSMNNKSQVIAYLISDDPYKIV